MYSNRTVITDQPFSIVIVHVYIDYTSSDMCTHPHNNNCGPSIVLSEFRPGEPL